MVKYSYELKRQVIQDYLDGLGGYKKLAQKYGLPTKSIILQWLNVYEHYGFEGLERKRNKRTYSREFKLNAVEYYLSKDISYREAANHLTALLRREGMIINEKRVLRVMRKLNLLVTNFHHKSRKYNSYRGYVGRVAKHLIRRRFETVLVHQKITTDTTEFKYYEKGNVKKAYLDPFIDLFNREVISYSLSKQPSAQSIMTALNQAIDITSDCLFRRTFHSDQGWAYQMHQYTDKLKEHRIFQSMSRKGNCLDNSVMENFFGLLKQEIYYGHTFNSYDELKQTIKQWIHYYNTKRVKKKLGWLSPIEYRLKNDTITKSPSNNFA